MTAVPAATRSGTSCGRGAVRQGQEDGVRRRQLGVDRQARPREVGMDAGDRLVVAAAAREADELDVRVAGQQPDQLGADVAGRADDPDPDPPRTPGRVDATLGAGEPAGPRRGCVEGLGRRHRRMTIQSRCIVMQPADARTDPLPLTSGLVGEDVRPRVRPGRDHLALGLVRRRPGRRGSGSGGGPRSRRPRASR